MSSQSFKGTTQLHDIHICRTTDNTADILQDAATITSILKDISAVLNGNVELSKSVPFNVKAKGQKDMERYKSLLHYQGPEKETIEVLAHYGDSWLQDPRTFWTPQQAPNLELLDPQAQIVGCFIQMDRSDA